MTPELVAALQDLTMKREMAAAHSLRIAVRKEDRAAYDRSRS